jgi:ABC-type transport system involved in multi-copper enzyme maturation permease subunit
MIKLPSVLSHNPIISQARHSRRRTWRKQAAIVLALISYCPALLIIFPYIITNLFFESWEFFVTNLDFLGQSIFYVTAIFLLVLVTLFAPTMSASTIAGERQRQTLDLLIVTLLPARSIIAGKLVFTLTHTLRLIAIAGPLIVIGLIVGGIPIIQLVVILLLLLTTATAFTIIGLFGSSLSRTTTNAVMLTYGLILPGFLIGPFLAMLPVTIILNLVDVSFQVEETINFYGWSLAASLNPISAAVYSAVLHEQSNEIFWSTETNYLIFPWVIYIIFYSLMSWLLVRLTIRRLERIGE